MPSRLMVGKNGFANSVRSRISGQGGVVGDATLTLWKGCVGSTGRLQRGPENGQRAPRRRFQRRTGRLKVWRQRIRSFGPN